MQVGDLVRYTGIGMKTGAIGYIKSKHIGINTLVLYMVTILTTGKEIGILESNLDAYEPRNQAESR